MDKYSLRSQPGISCSRLDKKEYAKNFADINPLLTQDQAHIESDRCYFCYDAPCINACPTSIDIPNFIQKIKSKNLKGAAFEILNQNIMGGTCARACPVEVLCEQACVRTAQEEKPVAIGALQRYATDWLFKHKIQPFKRKTNTGHTIAVVGAGPAGLSCAHALSLKGHKVVIFDAKQKSGGLNEYGLASYKMVDDFAQKEISFILSLGGIEVRHEQVLGRHFSLKELQSEYASVFIGIGLGHTNNLQLENESVSGIYDAVDYISQIRQTQNLSNLPVGRKVVVIGGGNTAVDIASQVKRLGAEDVTLLYRRGPKQMGATKHEQSIVQNDGVKIKFWAIPKKIIVKNDVLSAVTFSYTKLNNEGRLITSDDTFTLEVDMLFKAIGQNLHLDQAEGLVIKNGRIIVDNEQKTSLKNVYAGGDCTNGGEDLTVQAVYEGKKAAEHINAQLSLKGKHHG